MSSITPKPIIAHVVQTWDVPPGMKIALVVDIESRLWVVESCPAGTHFWTLAQVQMLPLSGRTGIALRAAVAVAHKLQEMQAIIATPEGITAVASGSSIGLETVANGIEAAAEQALLKDSNEEAIGTVAIALEFKAEKARPMTASSVPCKQGSLNARAPRRQAIERGDRSGGLRSNRQPSSRRADAILARAAS